MHGLGQSINKNFTNEVTVVYDEAQLMKITVF